MTVLHEDEQCPYCEIGELYYTGEVQDVDGYYHCYEMRCTECGSRIWDDTEIPGHEKRDQAGYGETE